MVDHTQGCSGPKWGPLDQRLPLGDCGAIPTGAILLIEQQQFAGAIAASAKLCGVQQPQREGAGNSGSPGSN